jgi:hypothetical protein
MKLTVLQKDWLMFTAKHLFWCDRIRVRNDNDVDDQDPILAKHMYDDLLEDNHLNMDWLLQAVDYSLNTEAETTLFNNTFMYMEEGEYTEGIDFSLGVLFESMGNAFEDWKDYVTDSGDEWSDEHWLLYCKFDTGEITSYRQFLETDNVVKQCHQEWFDSELENERKQKEAEKRKRLAKIEHKRQKLEKKAEVQKLEKKAEVQKNNKERMKKCLTTLLQSEKDHTIQLMGFEELANICCKSFDPTAISCIGDVVMNGMQLHQHNSKIQYNGTVLLSDMVQVFDSCRLKTLRSLLNETLKIHSFNCVIKDEIKLLLRKCGV